MNTQFYAISFVLLACCLTALLLQKKRTREQQKIRTLREKVQAALDDNFTTEKSALFATSLSQAAMTTRLQKTRIELQSGTRGGPPEKYTFFSSLVAKGMNAEEIAEILDISTTEASQLVRLCGLTGCRD
ncbi:MAG: hypothetical protein L3J49_01285 [Desulfobulbaceae bacterium]|nr:hypothetical protein [Desulfobulbaceae bacterium]